MICILTLSPNILLLTPDSLDRHTFWTSKKGHESLKEKDKSNVPV